MTKPQMASIDVQWEGETYSFRPEFDLFVKIDSKVSFSRIAEALERTGNGKGDASDIPMSHAAWILYCCLKVAGAPVRAPMDVQAAIFSGELSCGPALGALVLAYYGAAPEALTKKDRPEAEAEAMTPPPSRKLRKT
jgi:hypothetical protein